MVQTKEFYKKYVATYLNDSLLNRNNDYDSHVPPTSTEVEELIDYLSKKGADPIIVGSLAMAVHLNLHKAKKDDSFPPAKKVDLMINRPYSDTGFRLTQDIDLFISKGGVPKPPLGWKRDIESIGVISWIAPSGGYVDFLIAGHEFPNSTKVPGKIGKDPTAEAQGCPVADVISIFLLKLNSERDKDLQDLLTYCRIIGRIPSELRKLSLNQLQRDNLSDLNLWLAHQQG